MSNSFDCLLNGATETLRRDVLPHLAEPTARAAAASVLQVLDLLALRAGWSPAPLAEALAVRRRALAELATAAAPMPPIPAIPAVWPDPACASAAALQRALTDADAYVVSVIRWLDDNPTAAAPEQRRGIERWAAAYGKAAALAELETTPRSQTGALTSG